jgi:hypothetical protein
MYDSSGDLNGRHRAISQAKGSSILIREYYSDFGTIVGKSRTKSRTHSESDPKANPPVRVTVGPLQTLWIRFMRPRPGT